MRVCPRCKTPYQKNVTICPRDQVALSTLPEIIQAEVKVPKPIIAGSIVGNYRIIKKLGSGGMGAVYSASHLSLEKEFAIKILREDSAQNPKMLERFYREARSVAKIEHDHVIQISDFGCTPEGLTFLVMELLSGRSLEDALKAEKKLPVKRAVHIATQICSALSAAHQQKIIHRDLKPENIFLLSNKRDPDFVKVLDFGIAKILDESSNTVSQIMGTPLYMSPETGAAIDERTDVYALGVIFYRMFTGVLPFEGSNVMDILYKHLVEEPRPLRSHDPMIPEHIERAVLKALAKNKAERHASMDAFIVALREDDDATRMRALPLTTKPPEEDTLKETPAEISAAIETPTSISISTKLPTKEHSPDGPIEPVNPTIHLHTEDVIELPKHKTQDKIFTLNSPNNELPTNEMPSHSDGAALADKQGAPFSSAYQPIPPNYQSSPEIITLEKMGAPNPTPIYGEVTPIPAKPKQKLLIGLIGFLLFWGVGVGVLLFASKPKATTANTIAMRPTEPETEPTRVEPNTKPASLQAITTPATTQAASNPSPPQIEKQPARSNRQIKQIKQKSKKSKKSTKEPGPKGNPDLD